MHYSAFMDSVDLNLLTALDVLLTEGSVTGAARRLGLSSSAMSRTLTRLRASTGDPLLVRAGRGLVPTSHAAALRDRVHSLTNEVRTVLRPTKTHLDVAALELSAPEVRTQFLFRDKYVGIARVGHPLLEGGKVTPKRYAACNHVVASQLGEFSGPVDDALGELELRRAVRVVVPGYPDAMRVAQLRSDSTGATFKPG